MFAPTANYHLLRPRTSIWALLIGLVNCDLKCFAEGDVLKISKFLYSKRAIPKVTVKISSFEAEKPIIYCQTSQFLNAMQRIGRENQ
jgi:hypothetical protein